MSPARLAVLVSGGGSNMEAIATSCAAGGALRGVAEVALVVSSKEGVFALERARRLGVEGVALPHAAFPSRREHERAVAGRVRAARATHVVLAGYMRVLTAEGLAELALPVVNIHPVPTYWHQGAHGYEHLHAEAAAGRVECSFPTVHLVDAGLDTGEVILHGLPFATPREATLEALRDAGLRAEHAIFPVAMRRLILRGEAPSPGGVPAESLAFEARAAAFTDLVRAFVSARAHDALAHVRAFGLALPAPAGTLVAP